MKSLPKYWKIVCSRHMSTLYEAQIDTRHISEVLLQEFIRALMSKYALSDDEILEQYKRVPFKNGTDRISIVRTNSGLNEPLKVYFSAQVADIYVDVSLI